jgi:hypothetical protein
MQLGLAARQQLGPSLLGLKPPSTISFICKAKPSYLTCGPSTSLLPGKSGTIFFVLKDLKVLIAGVVDIFMVLSLQLLRLGASWCIACPSRSLSYRFVSLVAHAGSAQKLSCLFVSFGRVLLYSGGRPYLPCAGDRV